MNISAKAAGLRLAAAQDRAEADRIERRLGAPSVWTRQLRELAARMASYAERVESEEP